MPFTMTSYQVTIGGAQATKSCDIDVSKILLRGFSALSHDLIVSYPRLFERACYVDLGACHLGKA